ncbi:unnamed protein product, partial [Scytosiphon promiscuus]
RFYDALHAYEQIFCPTCHEMWPTDKLPADGGFEGQCDRCHRDVVEQRKKPSTTQVCKFSVENDMVPEPPPPELEGLTMSEEMMISMAFPVCKVVRLAGGAHGYEGSVISIGQDI